MLTVNLHQAKTQLSKLVDAAARGESFIIAKDGKPLVKVVAIDTPAAGDRKRVGFMSEITVPDDFDTMGKKEIDAMFYGEK